MNEYTTSTRSAVAHGATRRFHLLLQSSAAFLALAVLGGSVRGAERTWTGEVATDWLNPTNWSPRGIPANGDTATIANGTVTFSAPVVFGGNLVWTGGRLASGRLTLSADAVLRVEGTKDKQLGDATLENQGRVVWADAGRIVWVSRGRILNQAGGVWDMAGDGALASEFFEGGTVTNLGTWKKSGGGGVSSLYGPFHNQGLVDVQSGALEFNGGGGGAGGEFRAGAAGQNRFRSGVYVWQNERFTGEGTNPVVGSVTFDGTLASENLELAEGATLSGTNTLTGTGSWTGGRLASGRLTLSADAVLRVEGAADKQIGDATLENQGRVVWADAGRIVWVSRGRILNQAGGVWDMAGDGALASEFFEGGTVTNLGTWKKSGGGGVSSLYGPFHNQGLVDVQSGALEFNGGGGGAGGEFRAGAAGQNRFRSGVYVWQNERFTGEGTNPVVGSVTFDGTLASENLELAEGATLSGTNTLTGTGSWTGGRLASGRLTLSADAVLRVEGTKDKQLGDATLENQGRVVWADAGRIVWVSRGRILNQAGGVWDMASDGALASEFFEGGTVTNLGTWKKSGGGGVSLLYGPFHNQGLVDVQSGAFDFNGGGGGAGGEFRAGAAGQNRFRSGVYVWQNERFTGEGTNQVAGSVTFDGTLASENLELAEGATLSGTNTLTGTGSWTGGRLASGRLTLSADAVLRVEGTKDKQLGDATLENQGRVVWADAGRIVWVSRGRILNQAGGVWDMASDGALASEFFEGGTVTNLGTWKKSGGGGVSLLYGPFHNQGLVDVQSGAFDFNGGGGGAGGEFRAGAAGQNRFRSGVYVWQNERFTGEGTNQVAGSVTFDGTLASENLELAEGTLSGTSTLSGTGSWTGGRLASGRLTLSADAVLRVEGTKDKQLGDATLENQGRVVWADAGRIVWVSRGRILNQAGGVWDMASDGALASEFFEGGTVTNLGTWKKSGGSGVSSLYGAFRNDGALEVASGAVRFALAPTLTPKSVLSFVLGPTGTGVVQVDGVLNLQGTVGVRLQEGFVPEAGDRFEVVRAGSVTGQFANAAVVAPGTSWSFEPEYSATAVTLRAKEGTSTQASLGGAWVDGAFRVRLEGGVGETYRVDVSTNLIDWAPLFTTNLTSAVFEFTDRSATNYPSRFYRSLSAP